MKLIGILGIAGGALLIYLGIKVKSSKNLPD
jgi:threonine/homoserine/homoserine lactone efflux protein